MASFIFIDNNRLKIPTTTKVIKAESYASIRSTDTVLSEAKNRADEMMSKAREQAEEIVKKAEDIYVSEKQRGYREGLEQTKHEMAVEISAMSLKTAQYYHEVEKKIITLVMDTVKKVTDTADNGELIMGLTKKALLILKSQKQITLKVTPDHVDLINDRLSEIMNAYPDIDTIEVKGDDRISPTDLILESEIGIVNAGIETQLAAIEEAFSKCFPQKKTR